MLEDRERQHARRVEAKSRTGRLLASLSKHSGAGTLAPERMLSHLLEYSERLVRELLAIDGAVSLSESIPPDAFFGDAYQSGLTAIWADLIRARQALSELPSWSERSQATEAPAAPVSEPQQKKKKDKGVIHPPPLGEDFK